MNRTLKEISLRNPLASQEKPALKVNPLLPCSPPSIGLSGAANRAGFGYRLVSMRAVKIRASCSARCKPTAGSSSHPEPAELLHVAEQKSSN